MKSYDFEFDGQLLSEFGFIICSFDSDGIKDVSNGSEITFNTVPTLQGAKHELTSIEYNDCLTATIQICKHPCITNDIEVTLDETRALMRWLNRKDYHKFRLLDDDERINYYYEASFNVSRIELGGKIVGFELELFTNRPYALQEPISILIKNLQENGVKKFISKSDDEGYIYPEMKITIEQDGDLEIYNSLENRTMRIANCVSGEIIKLNYPMIESSIETHKIQNDFNWKFFRIANVYRDTINEITISIPCTIEMKYTPVVKVGI